MKIQLAIIGHKTRGKEVIEILQMLGGGKTIYGGTDTLCIYFLNESGDIKNELYREDSSLTYLKFEVFTLEEFLEKFPFKINDRVINSNYDCYGIINEMVWDSNDCCVKYSVKFEDIGVIACFKSDEIMISDVFYRMDNIDSETCKMTHKDAPNKICRIFISDKDYQDKVELCLGNDYEVVVDDNKTFVQRKKPKYPTTYEECCGILGMTFDYPDIRMVSIDEYNLYSNFIQLIRCRDAYWKIAGKEMGLGKPWEPTMETVYCISRIDNVIKCSYRGGKSNILEFPTKEMRDAFYENFKDLIEKCKELL